MPGAFGGIGALDGFLDIGRFVFWRPFGGLGGAVKVWRFVFGGRRVLLEVWKFVVRGPLEAWSVPLKVWRFVLGSCKSDKPDLHRTVSGPFMDRHHPVEVWRLTHGGLQVGPWRFGGWPAEASKGVVAEQRKCWRLPMVTFQTSTGEPPNLHNSTGNPPNLRSRSRNGSRPFPDRFRTSGRSAAGMWRKGGWPVEVCLG